jgi:hypothetical protein
VIETRCRAVSASVADFAVAATVRTTSAAPIVAAIVLWVPLIVCSFLGEEAGEEVPRPPASRVVVVFVFSAC